MFTDELDLVRCMIRVNAANELISGDINGKSDPYCVITVPNLPHIPPQQTQIIKNTLNPTWNEDFVIYYDSKFGEDLEFAVLDWDRIGNPQSLGQTRLTFHDIEQQEEFTLRLEGVNSGELCISARIERCNPLQMKRKIEQLEENLENTREQSVILQKKLNSFKKEMTKLQRITGDRSAAFALLSEDDSLDGKETENYEVNGDVWVLDITVTEGHDLIDTDTFSKSDPFVFAFIGNQSARTRTIKNNLNPEWNQRLGEFFITDLEELVRFEVYDEDVGDSKEAMGNGVLDVRYIVKSHSSREDIRISIPLQSVDSGSIDLKVSYHALKYC